MSIDDYTPPKVFATEHAPRERASQDTAAQHRARPTTDDRRPTPRRKPPYLPIAVVGVVLALALIFTRLPSVPPMQIAPTAAAQALSAPSSTPELSPSPTIVPSASPEPAQQATGHAESVPQTGRGLTIDVAPSAPAPAYLENVAMQAPHSPRGGLCGPMSGDCAPNPTAPPAMLEIIRRQSPHKVR